MGNQVYVEALLLDGQGKKMHIFNSLYHADGRLLATCEQILLHVSLETRRTTAPKAAVGEMLAMIQAHHDKLPRPEGIGRAVGQRK